MLGGREESPHPASEPLPEAEAWSHREGAPQMNSKFPCRGFMHACRSYHKMKGCLSPL